MSHLHDPPCGILLVDKPSGTLSFTLVKQIRRLLRVKKVGHSGTLDPFASGVMVLLVGRSYTRLANRFLNQDKEYLAHIQLGQSSDTQDCEGTLSELCTTIPTEDQVLQVVSQFQGTIQQTPPMYSAKKVGGKKLYELARQGIEIKRNPIVVSVQIDQINYTYPELSFRVTCSKGTYIRTLAHDIGHLLGCGAYLKTLVRTRSGDFTLDQCLEGHHLQEPSYDLKPLLLK